MKPVIGITASQLRSDTQDDRERVSVPRNYVDAVIAAGGVPMILPSQEENDEFLLELVDGLLFTGGADIDPEVYGAEAIHPETYGVDAGRDRFELALVNLAVERELPFFCICRGIQVLNVALGGTLIQDIPDQYSREIQHRQQHSAIDASEASHAVTVREGSLLDATYGSHELSTNSFHHQSVKEVAPQLEIDARTPDGVIEAVSLPGHPFALGVQWHPEMMFEAHAEHLAPFRALVEKARDRKLSMAPF
jgi:putative glutamine amidotransferase